MVYCDGIGVAKGGKSGGCGDELGGAEMFCPDKWNNVETGTSL